MDPITALGVASSAVQIANAGFDLYGALSEYIKNVRSAEKSFKRIAEEVRTTSWALQQLGEFLKEDEDLRLCKPTVIRETEEALKGCELAFNEVGDVLKTVRKDNDLSANIVNKVPLTVSQKLKWPIKKARAETLLAQLERLKTTLLLIFKVLSYAAKVALKTSEKGTQLLDERLQLEYLIRAKEVAIEKAKDSTDHPNSCHNITWPPPYVSHDRPGHHIDFPAQVSRTTTTDDVVITERTLPPLAPGSLTAIAYLARNPKLEPAVDERAAPRDLDMSLQSESRIGTVSGEAANLTCGPMAGNSNDLTLQSTPRQSSRSMKLLVQLHQCEKAVGRLSFSIDNAIKDLQQDIGCNMSNITRSLRETTREVKTLSAIELEADSDSDCSAVHGHSRVRTMTDGYALPSTSSQTAFAQSIPLAATAGVSFSLRDTDRRRSRSISTPREGSMPSITPANLSEPQSADEIVEAAEVASSNDIEVAEDFEGVDRLQIALECEKSRAQTGMLETDTLAEYRLSKKATEPEMLQDVIGGAVRNRKAAPPRRKIQALESWKKVWKRGKRDEGADASPAGALQMTVTHERRASPPSNVFELAADEVARRREPRFEDFPHSVHTEKDMMKEENHSQTALATSHRDHALRRHDHYTEDLVLASQSDAPSETRTSTTLSHSKSTLATSAVMPEPLESPAACRSSHAIAFGSRFAYRPRFDTSDHYMTSSATTGAEAEGKEAKGAEEEGAEGEGAEEEGAEQGEAEQEGDEDDEPELDPVTELLKKWTTVDV